MVYRRGLWFTPLMLCYLYNDMAYVTSDMIHTSGDGTWDMRTRIGPADWAPPLKIAVGKKGQSGWTGSSPRALDRDRRVCEYARGLCEILSVTLSDV